MAALGIDIGGSGIKGAPVDLATGKLTTERFRLPTPENATPEEMVQVVAAVARHFNWQDKIGVGFPAIVIKGVAHSAANIHKDWIGKDVATMIHAATGCLTTVVNDADAAGLAEMTFGAGRQWTKGVVLMVTLGTGIGSAVFVDGHLLPNTEFGHLEIRGKDAEWRASDAARQRKNLSWKGWGKRVNEYLQRMEALIAPDLIIVGGGISKEFTELAPYVHVRARVVPAEMLNLAGIVGAAMAVESQA
jgi:polyphosphate glucokinase